MLISPCFESSLVFPILKQTNLTFLFGDMAELVDATDLIKFEHFEANFKIESSQNQGRFQNEKNPESI